MPDYRASEAIYLCGENRMIAAGDVFSSNEPAGLAWIPIDPPTAKPASAASPARRNAAPART